MDDDVKVFWEKWLVANEIKRKDIIQSLVIRQISSYLKYDPVGVYAVSSLLNSWFEDLELVIKKS